MSVSIDGSGFLRDLKQLEEDLKKETKEAMRYAVEEAERHAKTTSLFNDRTGYLRLSVMGKAEDTEGEISANTPYAKFVEAGTSPHVITGNPWLTFYWQKAGSWVRFRRVNHPGTAPRPFMEKAGEWGGMVLYDGLSAFTQDIIRKYNSGG